MENLIGKMVHVTVSKDGKKGTKILKCCKVKARSVLFIEVDRENRKNTFRKVNNKDIHSTGMIGDSPFLIVKEGVIPDKWESAWDSIGSYSPMTQSKFGTRYFSNHSKGWASQHKYIATGVLAKTPQGASMDALAVAVSTRSTTNSAAGFPMV